MTFVEPPEPPGRLRRQSVEDLCSFLGQACVLQPASDNLNLLFVNRDREVLKKLLLLCKQLSAMEVLFSSQGSSGDAFPGEASDPSEMRPAARGHARGFCRPGSSSHSAPCW